MTLGDLQYRNYKIESKLHLILPFSPICDGNMLSGWDEITKKANANLNSYIEITESGA